MRDRFETLAALRPEERARLERFAQQFERIDATQYLTFAEVPSVEELAPAEKEAIGLLGSGARHGAARAAIAAFVDEATQAYSRRPTLTDTLFMFRSLPDRAEDRVRFLASVERVVVALILWDELTPAHRDVLVGRWATIVDRVVGAG